MRALLALMLAGTVCAGCSEPSTDTDDREADVTTLATKIQFDIYEKFEMGDQEFIQGVCTAGDEVRIFLYGQPDRDLRKFLDDEYDDASVLFSTVGPRTYRRAERTAVDGYRAEFRGLDRIDRRRGRRGTTREDNGPWTGRPIGIGAKVQRAQGPGTATGTFLAGEHVFLVGNKHVLATGRKNDRMVSAPNRTDQGCLAGRDPFAVAFLDRWRWMPDAPRDKANTVDAARAFEVNARVLGDVAVVRQSVYWLSDLTTHCCTIG